MRNLYEDQRHSALALAQRGLSALLFPHDKLHSGLGMATNSRAAKIGQFRFAKLDPLDEALELMFFGWKGSIRQADIYLASVGLSRVHHRILYAIARRDDLTVGELHEILSISKQALHRPMKQLLDQGFVQSERSQASHRHKILRLTAKGKRAEKAASDCERRIMGRAFAQVGKAGRENWSDVMAFVTDHG
jgi:DNA-binding MarR family transcriptional regulator